MKRMRVARIFRYFGTLLVYTSAICGFGLSLSSLLLLRFPSANIGVGISSRKVVIVAWTKYNGFRPFTDRWKRFLENCRKLNCFVSDNRSLVESADAVLFHPRSMHFGDLPRVRYDHQYYVFFNQEPPSKTWLHKEEPERMKLFNGFFNLTWTYRRDSDVVDQVYGSPVRLKTDSLPGHRVPNTTTDQLAAIVAGKTKLIAWFVSNCNPSSERQILVKEMMKYLPVDIYGTCAQKYCDQTPGNCTPFPRNAASVGARKLTYDYKFYVAFENDVCRDYITEKFFQINRYVVPIVMRKCDYEWLAPSGSFIAVDQFPTVKNLADYILYLNRTPDVYTRYYKCHESMYISEFREDLSLYEMCARLRDRTLPKSKIYDDMFNWWYTQAECLGGIVICLRLSYKNMQ